MPLHVHAATNVGRERTINEDNHAVVRLGAERCLLIVCDGMGGHEGGRLASATATEVLSHSLSNLGDQLVPAAIFDALHRANEHVIKAAIAQNVPTAGSTAVLALVEGDHYWMGWVGDSRLYQLRGRNIVERSRDHTRVAEMLERGILTAEQAHAHPDAHILNSALGAGKALGDPFKVSAIEDRLELALGDVIVLCSDGLYDLVSDAELPELLAGLDVEDAANRLITTANARGGHDNITVIVACWGLRAVPELAPSASNASQGGPDAPIAAEDLPAPVGLAAGRSDARPDTRRTVEDTPPDHPSSNGKPDPRARPRSAKLQPMAEVRRRPAPGAPSRNVDVATGLVIGFLLGVVFGWFIWAKLPKLRADSGATEAGSAATQGAANGESTPPVHISKRPGTAPVLDADAPLSATTGSDAGSPAPPPVQVPAVEPGPQNVPAKEPAGAPARVTK